MSASIPLQMAVPSWLEPGASAEVFEAGVAELGLVLEETGAVLDSGSPEVLATAYLGALVTATYNSRLAKENLRQLLLGVTKHPETAPIFRATIMRERAQAQTGWASQTRRRFAKNPTICLKKQRTVHPPRMVITQLNSVGRLLMGNRRILFSGHSNETVAVRMIGDVIVGIDFLKDGPPKPKPQTEFTLIYQNGTLVDSTYHGINAPCMAHLDQAVVKVYLNRFGMLLMGGRYWVTFNNYGDYPVEAEIRNGVVVEVRILKPAASLQQAREVVDGGTKELSLIYDAKGKLVDSFHKFKSEHWQTMTNHTIVTQLSNTGILTIGNWIRGPFETYPDGIVVVRVRDGHVTQVLFLNVATTKEVDVAHLKRTSPVVREIQDYSLIYNNSSTIETTFLTEFSAEELRQLRDHVVITTLGRHGSLYIGNQPIIQIPDHPNGVVALEIKDGVIVKIKLLNAKHIPDVDWPSLQPKGVKGEIFLRLVWDPHGRLIDSFHSPRFIPKRFRNHLGKITGDFRVDTFNGFLHGHNRYYFGDDRDYRDWPISEIVFGDPAHPGEITEFVIENPETKETIHLNARKYRQNLGDIANWVIEKIPPEKGEKAIGGREPKSVRRIGPMPLSPLDALLREEQIARVHRALERFSPEERELLLDAALLYYELRRKTLPDRFHLFWLVEEIQDELDTLDLIARQLEVERKWLIRSFEKLKEALKN